MAVNTGQPDSCIFASIWFVILKLSSNFWSIALGIWLLRSLGQWACSHLALRILKIWFEMDLDREVECELGQEDEQHFLCWDSLHTRVPRDNHKRSILEMLYCLSLLHVHKHVKGSEKSSGKENSLSQCLSNWFDHRKLYFS